MRELGACNVVIAVSAKPDQAVSGYDMKSRRIHLMGASGSGVTTLGRALAGRLALPHHDSDDYFWLPTAPPYQTTRPAADRLRLMREMFRC